MASFLARERRGEARRQVRRPYATRKPRDSQAKEPRELVQVGSLQIALENGEWVWQFPGVVRRNSVGGIHTRARRGLRRRFWRR